MTALMSCSGSDSTKRTGYYNDWEKGTVRLLNGKNIKINTKEFTVLRFKQYAKDDKNTFYCGHLVCGADARTFEVLGVDYAKDKNVVYFGKDVVNGAHTHAYRLMDGHYSTDGFDVFYEGAPLNITSLKSFRIVKGVGVHTWSNDGKYYYLGSKRIPSEDWAGFTILMGEGEFSKDKYWVYYGDHKLNNNTKGERFIDTIDAATFENLTYCTGRDKFGYIDIYTGRYKALYSK